MKNRSRSSTTASKAQACLHRPQRMQCSGRIRNEPIPWHLFARQYLSFTCSSYSSRKYLMVESTGFGALLPRPQSEPATISLPICSSRSMSPFSPRPVVILSRSSYICQLPTRQGGHLPQDSVLVNERKNFATSTMQSSSSRTTMPPEPMIEPTLASVGSIMGSGGMVVLDEDDCMVDVAKFFLSFTKTESCGKCPPCRVGNWQMYELLDRITTGRGEKGDMAFARTRRACGRLATIRSDISLPVSLMAARSRA